MKNLYKAISQFQQECPVIKKETTGYGYNYADLPTIYATIMPLLKKCGLGFTQLLCDEGMETVIFHIESGEKISGLTNIPQDVQLAKMNKYQVMGSAYTYYRRYALSAMLGIVTEEDNDSTGETYGEHYENGKTEYVQPVDTAKAFASKKVCIKCGQEHEGPYPKCITCWKKEQDAKPKSTEQAPPPVEDTSDEIPF